MPNPEVDILDRTRFAELIRTWSDETEHLSSTTRIADHPACREVVAMGEAAVPLLLGELGCSPFFGPHQMEVFLNCCKSLQLLIWIDPS